jgi:hypothetical protein
MPLHKNISVGPNPFALASTTSKTETFVCATHNLSFNDQDSVMQHIYDYHYGDPNTVCPICTARGGNPNFISSDIIGHIQVRHIGNPNYRPP